MRWLLWCCLGLAVAPWVAGCSGEPARGPEVPEQELMKQSMQITPGAPSMEEMYRTGKAPQQGGGYEQQVYGGQYPGAQQRRQ